MSDVDTTVVAVERRTSPVVLLVAVILLLVGLGALWVFVIAPLLDDDIDEPEAVETLSEGDPEIVPSPSPEDGGVVEPSEGEADFPVETYEVYLSRDPFRPVRPEVSDTGGDDEEEPEQEQAALTPGGLALLDLPREEVDTHAHVTPPNARPIAVASSGSTSASCSGP